MGELTGGLIHMTAHMITTAEAYGWVIAGGIVAAVFVILTACAAMSRQKRRKWRYAAAFAAFTAAGVIMIAHGAKLPRQKVIYCCASGPINLETVAARYDIIEVDGAFIKIAER